MYYCAIKSTDVANGEGVRVSLFVSGCRNHCRGCFNPETWDFYYGSEFTEETASSIIKDLDKPYISGLSVLGGDPFEPENMDVVCRLLSRVKTLFPEKTIWVYTGYAYEDFVSNPIMSCIDVLVDGRFVVEQRDPSLSYRGSRNQRIIDVKASLISGSAVLWQKKIMNKHLSFKWMT